MSKVILITGANACIGFELTRLLAEKGHTVYLGARNEVAGKEAAEILDVTKLPTIQPTKETIENAEGHLDVLVNNAGIAKFGTDENATTIALETIRDTMETNFYGLIQTTQTLLPLLRKSTNGVIVNVSTGLGSNAYMAEHKGPLHVVAYNTSKAAMNSYSIALAHELEKESIKVNLVTPGFTSTKLNFFGEGGKSVTAGAEAILPWALLEKDGPTGLFVNWDGNKFPW